MNYLYLGYNEIESSEGGSNGKIRGKSSRTPEAGTSRIRAPTKGAGRIDDGLSPFESDY